MEAIKTITATEMRAGMKTKSISSGWLTRQAEVYDRYRFGLLPILITLQSCVGSFACMYILKNDMGDVMLTLCAAITMGCNALFIAQAGAKLCLTGLYISLLINALLIAVSVG